jgi:glycerate kinase
MDLIAPTAFKGTMSPLEAARFLAREGDYLLPLSDGGDGFLECLHHKLGGRIEHLAAVGPFGRVGHAPVLILPNGDVAIESAKTIGMAGLGRLDPIGASSKGMGELLAQLQGAPRLLIGLGGSATVDGGMDWPQMALPPTIVFCDVRTGLSDAVRLFAPQKGASQEQLPILHKRLISLGLPDGPYTGAAGGLGAKLKSLGADLVSGAEAMMELLGFDEACQPCQKVVTGEGMLDRSTLEGKLPYVVAKRARSLGKRAIGRFGCRGAGWEEAAGCFDEVMFESDRG